MPAMQPNRTGRTTDIPSAVIDIAAGRGIRRVWTNEIGGLTFQIGGGTDGCFVKWAPGGNRFELLGEVQRLRWAGSYVNVPRLLDYGDDGDGAWLITTPIDGENAVTERWKSKPQAAVTAIGRGLRHLHDTLPVADCPFSWSARDRVADARKRAASGELTTGDWHPEHRDLTIEDALAVVEKPPLIDQLVVCHGDACAPNTLIGSDGHVSGHVDLGALGTADRWADLAVATWSTTWNYGPGWETALLDAYGIHPDPQRTDYYRLLWDLGPTGPAARI